MVAHSYRIRSLDPTSSLSHDLSSRPAPSSSARIGADREGAVAAERWATRGQGVGAWAAVFAAERRDFRDFCLHPVSSHGQGAALPHFAPGTGSPASRSSASILLVFSASAWAGCRPL